MRNDVPVCVTFHPNGIRYVRGGMAAIAEDIRNCAERLGIELTQPLLQQELFANND